LQVANIHAEQYRQQMAALQGELKQQTTLDPSSAATVNAQNAIAKASADRNVQIMQDAAANAAATWQGALRNANAVWVQDSQDSAKQVVELYQQGLSGLNDNISDLMVGKKSNFAGMFQGIGKTLGTDALKHVESPILGALGVGKADGSTSNPFSVKIVDGSGMAKGLQGLFGGSGSKNSDTSLFSKLFAPSSDDFDDDGNFSASDSDDDSESALPASGAKKAVGGLFGVLVAWLACSATYSVVTKHWAGTFKLALPTTLAKWDVKNSLHQPMARSHRTTKSIVVLQVIT
jgi:hypothetical protein